MSDKDKTIGALSREYGISRAVVKYRLKNGKPLSDPTIKTFDFEGQTFTAKQFANHKNISLTKAYEIARAIVNQTPDEGQ